MTYFVATLVGMVGGAALGFAVGLGASEIFARLEAGSAYMRSAATAGFVYVGPFGLLAGFLMGFGWVLRYAGGSVPVGNGAMMGGAAFLAVAAAMVLLPAMGRVR